MVTRILSLVLDVRFPGTSLIGAGSFMVIIEGLDFFNLSLVALPAWRGLGLKIQTSCKLFEILKINVISERNMSRSWK